MRLLLLYLLHFELDQQPKLQTLDLTFQNSINRIRFKNKAFTFYVFTSTPESQGPNPGCEWYQPTTISFL